MKSKEQQRNCHRLVKDRRSLIALLSTLGVNVDKYIMVISDGNMGESWLKRGYMGTFTVIFATHKSKTVSK